ncbi:MAG: hypothetical protein V1659_00335 [Candidatus Woesearchaeota archaeon]
MHSIKSFIRKFTDAELPGFDDFNNVHKIGRKFFLVEPELLAFQQTIPEQPELIGLFLGEEKKNFNPSLLLLGIVSETSEKKAFINGEAEWLFLCGRDVFDKNIVKANAKEGLVLVQNEKDENLGMGKLMQGQKGLFIKNILDKGAYLRDEGK